MHALKECRLRVDQVLFYAIICISSLISAAYARLLNRLCYRDCGHECQSVHAGGVTLINRRARRINYPKYPVQYASIVRDSPIHDACIKHAERDDERRHVTREGNREDKVADDYTCQNAQR